MKKILLLTIASAVLLANTACRQSDKQRVDSTLEQVTQAHPVTVSGRLIIGHEVSSFTADGDTLEYWVDDTTGLLQEMYFQVVGEDAKPYTPVKVTLQVTDCGKAEEGFAAEYDGVYRVEQIIDLLPMSP